MGFNSAFNTVVIKIIVEIFFKWRSVSIVVIHVFSLSLNSGRNISPNEHRYRGMQHKPAPKTRHS